MTGDTFFQNTTASDWTIQHNVYYNYAGGQVVTAGNMAGDSKPDRRKSAAQRLVLPDRQHQPRPQFGYRLPSIVGGWGPAGFVIPQTGIAPSDL